MNKKIQEFNERAEEFIVEMLPKLFERRSIRSQIHRISSMFDLASLLKLLKEKSQDRESSTQMFYKSWCYESTTL